MYHRDHARVRLRQALLSRFTATTIRNVPVAVGAAARPDISRRGFRMDLEIRPLTLEYVDALAYSGNRVTA